MGPIMLIVILGAAAVGGYYYWKFDLQQKAAEQAVAGDFSGIDCGAFNSTTESDPARLRAIACMSKALKACDSARMRNSSNILAVESYEIVGEDGAACQVRWTQNAKPPQSTSLCRYDMSTINATFVAMEARGDNGDNLFSLMAMNDVNNMSRCQ